MIFSDTFFEVLIAVTFQYNEGENEHFEDHKQIVDVLFAVQFDDLATGVLCHQRKERLNPDEFEDDSLPHWQKKGYFDTREFPEWGVVLYIFHEIVKVYNKAVNGYSYSHKHGNFQIR